VQRVLYVLVLTACGPREVTPTPDYGPPPEPVDPIACPAAALERFANRVGAPLAIATEPVVDAARIDKVPCKPAETDDACLARARTRPVPAFYEVAGIKIGGEVTHVEFTYELDGRRFTEQAPSMEAMVARLKAFQAKGHKVVVIRGESAADAGSRHAAIAYRGVGGTQRRVGTLRWRATGDDPDRDRARALSDAQAAAEHERMEIRSMQVTDDGELVVVATCGAGA